ncbi:MAG: STAS domain-containing protein [Anaerolineae bacterium]|nr:STAS domain-containing protein [Anaerolineae bacterium]
MNLNIQEHTLRIVVLSPVGAIDPLTAPTLRENLTRLLDDGVTGLIIDLSQVSFMDSAGMSVLVTALKRARAAGGNVKLVWPKSDAAKRILTLTKFDQVFALTNTADEALASWKTGK